MGGLELELSTLRLDMRMNSSGLWEEPIENECTGSRLLCYAHAPHRRMAIWKKKKKNGGVYERALQTVNSTTPLLSPRGAPLPVSTPRQWQQLWVRQEVSLRGHQQNNTVIALLHMFPFIHTRTARCLEWSFQQSFMTFEFKQTVHSRNVIKMLHCLSGTSCGTQG